MAENNGPVARDYSINVQWLKQQWREEWVVLDADRERKLNGSIGRSLRMNWIGDLLVATGHTVDYKTGKVWYSRKK